MARSATLLTQSVLTTGASSYVTVNVAPTANRILLIGVLSRSTLPADAPTVPTLSGLSGVTYTQRSTEVSTAISNDGRMTLFTAPTGASPGVGPITADFGGNAQIGCSIIVIETDNHLTTPFIQAKTAPDTGNATTKAATFDTTPVSTSTVFGFFSHNEQETHTPGTGLTELADGNFASPTTTFSALWDSDSAPSTLDVAWTTSTRGFGIIIELGVTAAAGVTGTSAVTFTFATAGTGTETFTGTSAVSFPFSTAGTGTETFTGTSAVSFPFSTAGTGAETITGTSAVEFAFATASVGEVVGNIGTSAVTFTFSTAGTGTQTFTGTSAVAFTFATAGAGTETFEGTSAVAFTFASAATGEVVSVVGTSAVTFTFSTAGVGDVISIVGTSAVAFGFSTAGVGAETFTGTSAVAFTFSTAAAGTETITGTSAVAFTFSTEGTGLLVSVVGTSTVAFSFSTAGTGTYTFTVTYAPPGLTGAVEYVVELFDSGGTFGPNTKLGEIWDARNVGWSRYDRLPGKGFLTLYQDSPHLQKFSPLITHVRITRVSPTGDTELYNGQFVDYDTTGDDVVMEFFDYLALFAISRSGYRVLYPEKLLGTEIAKVETELAIASTFSPIGFLTSGTWQDPLGTDGVTAIKTNKDFGLIDQMRLQLLYDLTEFGRANTVNHVTFEVTRTSPFTFNFWKDKGSDLNMGLILNGNVSDYRYLPNWKKYRNDLATLGTTVGGGATEIIKTNEAAAAIRGRRQDVATIKTVLGVTTSTVEADQQHGATARMLQVAVQKPPVVMVDLARGTLAPFDGWDICDTVPAEIVNGIDNITARQRIVGARGLFTEAGEDLGLIVEPVIT